jgi:hypothetical protein
LKVDTHGYRPSILHKSVGAAGQVKSHALASKVLHLVGDLDIRGRHINRLTEEIGQALARQRAQETEDYVHHCRQQPTVAAPEVVAVGLDGGRLLTRTPGQGVGVHGQPWKEDKVACLLTLKGTTFAEDPQPQPPKCFLEAPQVDALVRDMQSHHGPRQENELPQLAELSLGKTAVAAVPCAGPSAAAAPPAKPAWPPKRTQDSRTCVATMQDSAAFGKMVAAEA